LLADILAALLVTKKKKNNSDIIAINNLKLNDIFIVEWSMQVAMR